MNEKVLVIDDDRELCEEICEILADEGYRVNSVNDGKSGLDELVRNKYDMVLLDLKVPSMNGVEILGKIREKKLKVKVIVLTGKPMGRDLNVYTDKGDEKFIVDNADSFINKPYDIEKLLAEIKRLLHPN